MATNVRNTYVNSMVSTAGPERLLLLLLDRLKLDIQRAVDAQAIDQHEEAGRQLMHAQDIVLELRSSLQVDAWEGGPALSSIYEYLLNQLVTANVRRDVEVTRECQSLVEPLVDAWRQAALIATAS